MLKKSNNSKFIVIGLSIIIIYLIYYFDLICFIDYFLNSRVNCSDNHLTVQEMVNKHNASLKAAESRKFLVRLITVACCIVIMIIIHKDDFQ